MAQNYMMGAGMVPPPAPTQPSPLSFKSDPNQRMQFKSFMQGLSAPRQAPMAPQMMPMPQIPVPMQNIDVFSQPVQYMARGGLSNRPVSEMKYTPENVEKEKRTIRPRPERDDDDREDKARKDRTNKQIAEANAIAAALSSSRPPDTGPGEVINQTVAELAGRYPGSQLPSSRTDLFDPSYIANIGLTNVDSMPMVPQVYDRISELDAEDGPPVDPRQSGLGSTLSQQIAALRGDPYGDAIASLNQASDIFGDDDISGGKSFFPVTNVPQDITALDPNALSRFGQFLGTDRFYDGQIGQLQEFASIPGSQYDYDTGGGIAQAGQGTLTMSPSGVVTYDGPRDANYTGPFEKLINPPRRPEKDPRDPCPPGYTLINGACMPISQPTQATPTTPAPNVIQNIPVTAPAPSPVVQSTAPPAQLGMPLGQPTPIQPMSQFLTNIPNSLNLAANNFLSALSS